MQAVLYDVQEPVVVVMGAYWHQWDAEELRQMHGESPLEAVEDVQDDEELWKPGCCRDAACGRCNDCLGVEE